MQKNHQLSHLDGAMERLYIAAGGLPRDKRSSPLQERGRSSLTTIVRTVDRYISAMLIYPSAWRGKSTSIEFAFSAAQRFMKQNGKRPDNGIVQSCTAVLPAGDRLLQNDIEKRKTRIGWSYESSVYPPRAEHWKCRDSVQ